MTTEIPNVTKTGRYTIGKAAQALEINRSTLRRYCERMLIKPSYSRVNKRKIFTGEQIIQLWKSNS